MLSSQPRIPGFKTLAPNAGYAKLNPPAPPPDALNRYLHNGQHATAKPAKPIAQNQPGNANANTPTGSATPNAFDLSTDPIVQKIRALNTANYGDAVAGADAQRKQLLVNSGFADLARAAQFGSLESPTTGDEATALAAQQNPFSTAAQLAHSHAAADRGIDQGANDANLYYSSARANNLGDEARNYLQNESTAESQVRSQLDAIIQSLVQARSDERTNEENAIETARQNAINNAIASGQSFLGYDSNGNPIFGGGSGSQGQTGPAAGGDTGTGAGAAGDVIGRLLGSNAGTVPSGIFTSSTPKASKKAPVDALNRYLKTRKA